MEGDAAWESMVKVMMPQESEDEDVQPSRGAPLKTPESNRITVYCVHCGEEFEADV